MGQLDSFIEKKSVAIFPSGTIMCLFLLAHSGGNVPKNGVFSKGIDYVFPPTVQNHPSLCNGSTRRGRKGEKRLLYHRTVDVNLILLDR